MSRTAAARLAYLALYAAVGASFPYLSVFYGERGLNLETIGLFTALAAAAGLVGAPVWGALADRFAGSRLVLPAAGLLAAGGAVLLAGASGPLAIGLAVVAMNVSMAGMAPMLDARALGTVHGDRNRYGGLRAWGSASFIAVVWLTGALIGRAGAAGLFTLFVPALVMFALVTLPLRGAVVDERLPRLTGIGVVLRHPPLARFLAAILLVWSASMAINWYLSIHLLALGATGDLVGAAWAIGALVEIPVMGGYPWLARRVGAERLLLVGACAFAARALAIALVTDPLAASMTMVLHGVGFALVLVGGVTYVAGHAPRATAATAQGILSATVFSLALIIGPTIGSLAAGVGGPSALFLTATVASVVAMPALWWALGRSVATPERTAAAASRPLPPL